MSGGFIRKDLKAASACLYSGTPYSVDTVRRGYPVILGLWENACAENVGSVKRGQASCLRSKN